MLCASGEGAYVHEPFNPNRAPGWFRKPPPYWFVHITRENEGPYFADIRAMVDLRYPLRSILRARRARLLAMNVQQAARATADRLRKRRLLLKDPLALFSAEWLAGRFEMEVVILVRHPASFISSIKRLNWGFDYEQNWLAQPLLMRDLLSGYESTFADYVGERDLVGEGIVVWNAMYDVVSKYQERHPDWAFIRYEDLAEAPKAGFRSMYDRLGLTWSSDVERTIAAHSGSENPAEVEPDGKHVLRRDSWSAARTWHDRLSRDEVGRVREETEAVWRRFYDDAAWEASPPSTG